MANLAVGTKVVIRENYTNLYKIFGFKGTVKSVNTTCKQYNQSQRVEYYDIEAISMLTKKMELIPVMKHHVKPTESNSIKSIVEA